MHETWWLNWRWITSCEQLVQPQPGLSHPGCLMNHLKAAAWAGDWLLVSFVNITWPVSGHVPCQRPSYTLHHIRVQYGRSLSIQNTIPQTTRERWTGVTFTLLPACPPVQGAARPAARLQSPRSGRGGVGEWDDINANWIYISTFHRSHLTKNQNTVTHKLAS